MSKREKTKSQQEEQVQEQVAEAVEPAAVDAAPEEVVADEAFESLQRDLAEWKDKYLRLSAEFDNYRKRTLREKGELVSRAAADTLLHLLPVVDDFDRALAETENGSDVEALREGLRLVYRNVEGFLTKCGVSQIQAAGEPFDSDYHEAVVMTPSASEEMRGRVIEVLRKGYLLNGHVLRYAQVVVGE